MTAKLAATATLDDNLLVSDLINVVGGTGLGNWRKLRALFCKVKSEVFILKKTGMKMSAK